MPPEDEKSGLAPGTSGEDFNRMVEETSEAMKHPDQSRAPTAPPGKTTPDDGPDFRHGQDT